MLSTLKNFVWRHKKKFIFSGVFISGTILLSRYAQYKLIEWQEQKTKELFERTRKCQHFESTERTCNETILSLYKTLIDQILQQLSTDELVETLKTNPDNRIEIWHELKVIAFTRLTVVVYASVILVALLRVQLNVLGGYIFKNSDLLSSEFRQKYLSLCGNYLNSLEQLIVFIKQKTSEVLATYDLKQKMDLQSVEVLFWSIQASITNDNDDPISKINDYLVKNNNDDDELFRTIIIETLDLLESEEVKFCCMSNISRGFSILMDCIAEYYFQKNREQSGSNGYIDGNKKVIHMIKLIPIVNGMMSPHGNKKFVDELIPQLLMDEGMKKLGANIYEAFCSEPEV